MKILTKHVKSLCVIGKKLFIVRNSDSLYKSYIEEVKIAGKPYKIKGIGWFIRVQKVVRYKSSIKKYHTIMSLRDANIIPNKYNNHKTFTKKYKAEAFASNYDRNRINSTW